MLLNMEQQIAACTGGEKVLYLHDTSELRNTRQLLSSSPDIVWRCAKSALVDHVSRGHDVAARKLAVEAHAHEAVRPQQREQDAPAGRGVREMMQHTHRLDHVKGPADRVEFVDVCLTIFDVFQAKLVCFSLSVGEAG